MFTEGEEVLFPSVVGNAFPQPQLSELPEGDFVRIPTTTLLTLLKAIGSEQG